MDEDVVISKCLCYLALILLQNQFGTLLCIETCMQKDFSQKYLFWREFFWPKNAYIRNEQVFEKVQEVWPLLKLKTKVKNFFYLWIIKWKNAIFGFWGIFSGQNIDLWEKSFGTAVCMHKIFHMAKGRIHLKKEIVKFHNFGPDPDPPLKVVKPHFFLFFTPWPK